MGRAGDIQFKRGKSTFMSTHPLAVEPDLCAAIDTVKEQFDASTSEVSRYLHMPAISAGSGVAVKARHDPMRGNFDVLPVRIGEIWRIEARIRIGLKMPKSVQIKGGDA